MFGPPQLTMIWIELGMGEMEGGCANDTGEMGNTDGEFGI